MKYYSCFNIDKSWNYHIKEMKKMLVTQLCLTLCSPKACSLSGSSVHRILQARILEWVAIPFSRGSSWPRGQTDVSHITGRFFTCLSHRGSPHIKEVRYKKLHSIWFHSCEASWIGKSIKIENRWVVARGWSQGQETGSTMGKELPFWGNKMYGIR